MPRMLDLIRQSAVPSNVMRSAAKGALTLPPAEIIEILVYLATSNPVFGEQAQMTLAGWDEAACATVVGDPQAPKEILDYFFDPKNRRPKLVPPMLENPSVAEEKLVDAAQSASRELVEMMLHSARVQKTDKVLHALKTNPHLDDAEQKVLDALLAASKEDTAEVAYVADSDEKSQWEIDHAAEIAAEEGKPFEMVGGIEALHADLAALHGEEIAPDLAAAAGAPQLAAPVAPPTASAGQGAPAVAPSGASSDAATPAAAMDPTFLKMREAESKSRERLSALQKIQRMSVGERVQLAFKGNKEERFILIRDGSRVVSDAVLESPKITDAEVELFASMKNVQESVLRHISMKRAFMKNYAVVRCLVNNPRCPLDLSLTLMNHLLVNDLKGLSMNKNVPETLRKLALKNFKQKAAAAGGKKSGE